jgi:16S rRNA (cytidine1402-2'-O)-methyltransferase
LDLKGIVKAASSQLQPGLYLVATPIGNLGDITLRALETLKNVDLIVCEDTRVTGKLLNHYSINKFTLSYNDHNGSERRPKILEALKEGKRVALLSDAGTPLVSDPGYKLVREALAEGYYVTTLPGASSVLSALCLSGLPSDQFFFAGFLPAKEKACYDKIQALASIPSTLILFESARRLPETLGFLTKGLGNREAAVVREISKLYEESKRGPLQTLQSYYEKHEAKGEVVIVIAPPGEAVADADDIESSLKLLLLSHSVKEAASIIAEQTGKPRKDIYTLALTLMKHGKE